MKQDSIPFTLNFGQVATVGPFQLEIETDGETIHTGRPVVGFLHRGIEKIAERMPWQGFIPYTDRVDYLSAIHCNYAYALAVESLAQIVVPRRAVAIRTIVAELNRIGSHLLNLANVSKSLGASAAQMYAIADREKINNLFEMLAGARLTYSFLRIGGVAVDITEGFLERCYEFLNYFESKLEEYETLLTNNYLVRGRLKSIGIVDPVIAVNAGVSGPILRASGKAFDLRKARPYGNYSEFSFEIPTSDSQDAFGRLLVRLSEMQQAIAILKQALDQLPSGDFCANLPKVFKPAKGQAYAAVESPRGIFGVYVMSSGEKYPARVKFRTPSFAALGLFPSVVQEVSVADLAPVLASLDISASEVDR